MTINQARQELVNIFGLATTPAQREALVLADMALKTIDDMDTMLSKLDNNETKGD